MTTIDITEHLAQFTACGLIVVDGDLTWFPSLGGKRVAPELWRELTEPCATCRGSERPGFLYTIHDVLASKERHWLPCPNPDCDRGRQVVTLTATCPNDCRLWRESRACAQCSRAGVITLGRFTIRLLPFVGGRNDEQRPPAPYAAVYAEGDVVLVYPNVADTRTVRGLDPLPQPGQWAVQFEAVGT